MRLGQARLVRRVPSLTFEVLDDELLRGAGFRIRETRRDFVDAVRIADCQRRKVGPLLGVSRSGGSGRCVRHDDFVTPNRVDFVRMRDACGRGQLAALGCARVLQHHREIGGGGGSGDSGSDNGGGGDSDDGSGGGSSDGSDGGGNGGDGGGCLFHLSSTRNLDITMFRHTRASPGRRPSVQRGGMRLLLHDSNGVIDHA